MEGDMNRDREVAFTTMLAYLAYVLAARRGSTMRIATMPKAYYAFQAFIDNCQKYLDGDEPLREEAAKDVSDLLGALHATHERPLTDSETADADVHRIIGVSREISKDGPLTEADLAAVRRLQRCLEHIVEQAKEPA